MRKEITGIISLDGLRIEGDHEYRSTYPRLINIPPPSKSPRFHVDRRSGLKKNSRLIVDLIIKINHTQNAIIFEASVPEMELQNFKDNENSIESVLILLQGCKKFRLKILDLPNTKESLKFIINHLIDVYGENDELRKMAKSLFLH